MTQLSDLPPVACPLGGGAACPACVEMCATRPCWGTPADAQALIAAGEGGRLMRDWWVGGGYAGGNIDLLAPAMVGREGGSAPAGDVPEGRCTFLDAGGLCTLHARGLKPLEGRLVDCQGRAHPGVDIHELVAQSWNTPDAQALVAAWRQMHE